MYEQAFDSEDSEVNEEQAKALGEEAGAALAAGVVGFGVIMISSIVSSIILSILVTNYRKENMAGNESVAPVNSESTLEDREVSAAKQDSKLSQQDFKAQDSKVSAAHTDGKVVQANSHVSKNDVNAVNTQTGTIDTSAKAMKIN